MTDDLKDIPGLKESEMRALATCGICGKKLGEDNPLGLFYVVNVERYMLDPSALRR